MKVLILLMTLLNFTSCQASNDNQKMTAKNNIISKKYFVKGMTCGGCILGVKTALAKSENLKILEKDINVGEATLQFEEKYYKQSKTDCDVTKSIEKVTEFKVYLDKNHTQRACGS